ncbi:uncharacterized protein LOC119080316 [Bradysia coprophila]|uniref:uncharacterized protein LOC119080316 n=1 Tax=Bradysia coprophila TaxID=38358 RepID=UPI00187DBE23|nr:uncharacterized protein LOC119080316 [Bradysia coprophila]
MATDNIEASPMEYNEDPPKDVEMLKLPIEIIKNILLYVDDHSRPNAALVCRTFYELICELDRDKNPLDLLYSEIYDDDIYKSLINSGRQFSELFVNLKGCHYLHSSDRIVSIAKNFGSRIKKVKFWCSLQAETPKVTDLDLMTVLKFLPDVEEIILFNIYVCSDCHRSPKSELDLYKLKRLDLNFCSFDNTLLLDLIPTNVLTDLVFTFDSLDETIYQNFFNRQGNIKKLEIFENDKINFDHLELEHLKISSGMDFVVMLNQQRTLKYIDFAISWIDGKVFAAVLQLKDLEVLRTLVDQVPCVLFKELKQLKHLKELRIDSHCSFDCGHLLTLSMMNDMNLEKLTLYYVQRDIPPEIFIQISKNFLKLRHIQIVNRSIQNLITIAQHFPNMESILWDFSGMFYSPDILQIDDYSHRHENLTQIVITNLNTTDVQNTQPLLKFCNSCPNLERIFLSNLSGLSLSEFEELFTQHRKLTHLSLEVDSFEFDYLDIVLVSKLISDLHHFRASKLLSCPTYSVLKCLFRDFFPKITLYKYSTGEAELIMKRRRAVDWYSSFNIRDHF